MLRFVLRQPLDCHCAPWVTRLMAGSDALHQYVGFGLAADHRSREDGGRLVGPHTRAVEKPEDVRGFLNECFVLRIHNGRGRACAAPKDGQISSTPP